MVRHPGATRSSHSTASNHDTGRAVRPNSLSLEQKFRGISELKATMKEMLIAKEEIEAWKPVVDNHMAELESAIADLGERVEHLLGSSVTSQKPKISIEQPAPATSSAGGVLTSNPTHLGSTPIGAASGPNGHRVEHRRRGTRFGVVYTTLEPSPVTGAHTSQNPPPVTVSMTESACCGYHVQPAVTATLPDLAFPKFDGSNPRL